MTLPASGTLSASQINTEVGRAWNTPGGAGEQIFRDLAEVGGGGYSGAAFYGKSVIKPLKVELSRYLIEETFRIGMGRPRFYAEVTCNPMRGNPPYSFNWELVENRGSNPFNNGVNGAKIIFSSDPSGEGMIWRCKVTDSAGAVVYSDNLVIKFYYKKINTDIPIFGGG